MVPEGTERTYATESLVCRIVEDSPQYIDAEVQGPSSEATVELDVSGLKDGNVAGFGVFEFPYAYVAVEQTNGEKKIVMCNDGQTIETIDRFEGNKIWIRARVMDVGFRAVFYYSTDGEVFPSHR